MFETLQQKIIVGVFVFLLLAIPIGAYLVSQRQEGKASAQGPGKPITQISSDSGQLSPLEQIKQLTDAIKEASPTATPLTTATTYGPTMNLKLIIEGRPAGKQASKVFIGISDGGSATTTPKYVLSFTIDLPDSGLFSGLSLAGLTAGSRYTAYIKGPAQIATSSAFTMSPSITYLNNLQPINLKTGDLNEDNVINSADYAIAKASLGAIAGMPLWNDNIDFNRDGVINSFDLAIILKNMSQTGQSGVWGSPIPASKSASLITSPGTGGLSSNTLDSTPSGYWIWVPK